MPQQFAKCMNYDTYVHNFLFFQLPGLRAKPPIPQGKQSPLQAVQAYSFPGPYAGWESTFFFNVAKIIRDV